MNIYDNEELDLLGSSSRKYENKIKELKSQKEFIERINSAIDETIIKLENGDYLPEMVERKKKLLETFKGDISFTITTGLLSGMGIYNIANFQDTTTSVEALIILIITVLASSSTIFLGCKSAEDLKKYNSYNKEIESYERRLK